MIEKIVQKVIYTYKVGNYKVCTSDNLTYIKNIEKKFPKAEEYILLLQVIFGIMVSSIEYTNGTLKYNYLVYTPASWDGNRPDRIEHHSYSYEECQKIAEKNKYKWNKFKDMVLNIKIQLKLLNEDYHISYINAHNALVKLKLMCP